MPRIQVVAPPGSGCRCWAAEVGPPLGGGRPAGAPWLTHDSDSALLTYLPPGPDSMASDVASKAEVRARVGIGIGGLAQR